MFIYHLPLFEMLEYPPALYRRTISSEILLSKQFCLIHIKGSEA